MAGRRPVRLRRAGRCSPPAAAATTARRQHQSEREHDVRRRPPGRRPIWLGHDRLVAQGDAAELDRDLEQPARGERHPVSAMGVLRRAPRASRRPASTTTSRRRSARRSASRRRSTRRRSTASSWPSRAAIATWSCRTCTTTPQREKPGVSFVDYAYDGTSILVLKGNPKGVTNLDSLAGQTVACESGTTQQALPAEPEQAVHRPPARSRRRSSRSPTSPPPCWPSRAAARSAT